MSAHFYLKVYVHTLFDPFDHVSYKIYSTVIYANYITRITIVTIYIELVHTIIISHFI